MIFGAQQSAKENVMTKSPYRTNAMPESPPLPWKKRYPRIYQYLTGLLSLVIFVGVVAIVFPGAYYLGMWVSNSLFNWGVEPIKNSPAGWFIGVGLYGLVVGIITVPYKIGSFHN